MQRGATIKAATRVGQAAASEQRDHAISDESIRDQGIIDFVQYKAGAKAPFIRVDSSISMEHLADNLHQRWDLDVPGFLLTVAGWGDDPDVDPSLVLGVCEGVVRAATATDAWLFSRGFDSGIMSALGDAVARNSYKCSAPLIGVSDWPLHVGLAGADPDFTDEHVFERFGFVSLDDQFMGSAGWQRGQFDIESTGLI